MLYVPDCHEKTHPEHSKVIALEKILALFEPFS